MKKYFFILIALFGLQSHASERENRNMIVNITEADGRKLQAKVGIMQGQHTDSNYSPTEEYSLWSEDATYPNTRTPILASTGKFSTSYAFAYTEENVQALCRTFNFKQGKIIRTGSDGGIFMKNALLYFDSEVGAFVAVKSGATGYIAAVECK